jgi:hypothetical protein
MSTVTVTVKRSQNGNEVFQTFEPRAASFFTVPCPQCNAKCAVEGNKDDELAIRCKRHGVYKLEYKFA